MYELRGHVESVNYGRCTEGIGAKDFTCIHTNLSTENKNHIPHAALRHRGVLAQRHCIDDLGRRIVAHAESDTLAFG